MGFPTHLSYKWRSKMEDYKLSKNKKNTEKKGKGAREGKKRFGGRILNDLNKGKIIL